MDTSPLPENPGEGRGEGPASNIPLPSTHSLLPASQRERLRFEFIQCQRAVHRVRVTNPSHEVIFATHLVAVLHRQVHGYRPVTGYSPNVPLPSSAKDRPPAFF